MVERFRREHFEMRPYAEGMWVRHSDYAALEAQLAELAAENERMKQEAAEWEVIARAKSEEALTHRREAEAMMSAFANASPLASTGAVKALPRPDTVSMSGGAICLEYADYDLRDAAYDWLEAHGAGGELANHQRATNTVDAHEKANVSDKPEFQQEPVPAEQAVTEAMVETEMVRMTISETIRAMGANPDEQLIGELTVFDAIAAKVRSALTAAQEAGKS